MAFACRQEVRAACCSGVCCCYRRRRRRCRRLPLPAEVLASCSVGLQASSKRTEDRRDAWSRPERSPATHRGALSLRSALVTT